MSELPEESELLERQWLPDIRERIDSGDLSGVSRMLATWLSPDLAALVIRLELEQQLIVLRALDTPRRVETIEHLDLDTQQQLLAALSETEVADILNRMSPDDRTALLEDMPETSAAQMMSLLSPEERTIAESLLHHGEDTVGRLMTPDFVSVRKGWSIKRVLDHIRTHGKDSETLSHIYVTDENGTLLDDIRIREVLLSPLHRFVSDIMDNQFASLSVTYDKRAAVEVFRRYDRSALPVIDSRGILVGIVTIDDVIDVAEEEATRDFHRFGGMEALEAPYRTAPISVMVQKRASWLVLLFLGEMLTATAMGYFEDEIARAVVLALFVPLIISSGGNSGSQAATLLIRALALQEVRLQDWFWVLRRELVAGAVLGCVLGSIGFLRIALWNAFSGMYGPHWELIGLTVGLSLVGVVLWGTVSGSMLPFLLKRLGFDPATSSAPFVATLVDVTGLIIYFTTALFVLRGTLL